MEKTIMIWIFYSALMALLTAMFSNKKLDSMAHYSKWVMAPIWIPLTFLLGFFVMGLSTKRDMKEFGEFLLDMLFPYDENK